MFDNEMHSFGELDEQELTLAIRYLAGETWTALFQEYDAESHGVPEWLVKWSAGWSKDELFSIDGLDPIWMNASVIADSTHREFWFCDEGCETPVVMPIASKNGELAPENLHEAALEYLNDAEDLVLSGNFAIHSPELLPLKVIKPFMESKLESYAANTVGGEEELGLAEWLEREYGKTTDTP